VQTLTSLREAQTATAAAHAGSGEEGGDAVTVATLKAESEKLREALRRLNSSSVQDKQTLATQGARLSALDQEVVALRVRLPSFRCRCTML
jgi:NAD(P)H-hydrate repair Nnr-like enzyme with NAD(P)H-hydrate epimerase domain